jgi:hypothetical protein
MTTDLVRYEPRSSIDLAPEAWSLAQKVAATEFVPRGLRNKPEAVLAAMLTGHEIGVGPMQALAKIHVVDGRPAMAAELMRGVILAHGHEVWIEESTNTRVTVGGRRKDSSRESRFTWTLDDAKTAGLAGKDNWRKYPRAMLLARATAELARAMFPDVLAGLSYTVEELSDGEVFDAADLTAGPTEAGDGDARPPVKKAAARKAATRKRTAPPAPATSEAPPLPGEDEPDPFPDAEPPDDRHETEAKPLPGPAAIAVALKAKGIEDRDDKLRIVSEVIGREVTSTKDLEPDMVGLVLRTIEACSIEELEQMAAPDADVVSGHSEEPPAPKRDEPAASPDGWSEAAWREFLSSRGVKVTELLKEAQRLAREDGDQGPTTLEALVSAGAALKELLVGFVEDLAAQRGAS